MRKLAGCLVALIFFTSVVHMLNYMLVSVDSDYKYRIVWHQFYEAEGKIDNLYLGSSHVQQDIIPQILDELNGQYNFNLSTPSQQLRSSYYLLREADQRNELKHVYLELHFMCSTKPIGCRQDPIDLEPDKDWCNTDYMRLSLNKLEYFLAFVNEDIFMEASFPFVRYRQQLGEWDYVRQTMEEKGRTDYQSYQYHYDHADGNGYDEFREQGFFCSTRRFEEKGWYYRRTHLLNERPMSEKSREYCSKIIEYCQKKDIPITLFVSPTPDLLIVSAEGYDHFINEVREIAEEYGVPYYDFNIVREEYLPIQNWEYFREYSHLNNSGAEMFTRFFNQIVSEAEIENQKCFYGSYAEKLKETEPAVYGIYEKDATEIGGGVPKAMYCQ